MDKEEIEKFIRKKIAEHELRVAVFSGLGGALLLLGYAHAVWLNKIAIEYIQDFLGN